MQTTFKSGHTVITADENYFLRKKDGEIHGVSLSLGVNDKAENYDEVPMSECPEEEENTQE